jgi:arylsulfatase A-like enzyme
MKGCGWLTLGIVLAVIIAGKCDVPVYNCTAKKLVFIVVDGPRWEETWGDNSHQYQPYLRDSLQQYGSLFTKFYNKGITLTLPGHTALLTGHYQDIANDGTQYPVCPSLAQLFLAERGTGASDSWLVTSKDKLEVLKSCTNSDWKGHFTPDTDCGPNGNGTGYREDSITFSHAINVMQQQHPDFIFIHFREPDFSGHANNWPGYLNGIKQGDKYCWQIWKFIQSSPHYQSNTNFVITNDHGRHHNGIADGFVSHGDGCDGCRHINLFMAGPDVKKGQIVTVPYEQVDLHKTLCYLYGLDDRYSEGKIIQGIAPR